MSAHPWDFHQSQEASRDGSANQRRAEKWLIDAFKDYAAKEEAYRVALATRILEFKAGGMAITACGDLARGDKKVARLKLERDVAEGVKEAAAQSGWRASADRKDTLTFIEWSQRAAFRDEQEPATASVIGGRRAAA